MGNVNTLVPSRPNVFPERRIPPTVGLESLAEIRARSAYDREQRLRESEGGKAPPESPPVEGTVERVVAERVGARRADRGVMSRQEWARDFYPGVVNKARIPRALDAQLETAYQQYLQNERAGRREVRASRGEARADKRLGFEERRVAVAERPKGSSGRGLQARDIPRNPDDMIAWVRAGMGLGVIPEEQGQNTIDALAKARAEGQTGPAGTGKGSKVPRLRPSFEDGIFGEDSPVSAMLEGKSGHVVDVVSTKRERRNAETKPEMRGTPEAKVVGWLQAVRETSMFFATLHPDDRASRQQAINSAAPPVEAVLSARGQDYITTEEMAQVFKVTGPPTVADVVAARERGDITVEIQREIFKLMDKLAPGSSGSGFEAKQRQPAKVKPAGPRRPKQKPIQLKGVPAGAMKQ